MISAPWPRPFAAGADHGRCREAENGLTAQRQVTFSAPRLGLAPLCPAQGRGKGSEDEAFVHRDKDTGIWCTKGHLNTGISCTERRPNTGSWCTELGANTGIWCTDRWGKPSESLGNSVRNSCS